MQKITPFLWFDNNAEEAMKFYCSVFKDSKIISTFQMGGVFEIFGQQFMVLNGGPMFKQTEAFSIYVDCKDQEEIDYYWNKLTADGGQESRCGWLKDKYGVSWQIIPTVLQKYLWDSDPVKAKNAMNAMMKMNKIIIKELEAAHNA
jgi:predicted 3-demethylubiquinone-9 3-methyltransferase (glyoxalase superfamily)